MKLDVALLDGTTNLLGAVHAAAPGIAAERLSAATDRGRGFENPLAVKTDPRVLLDRSELRLQRRVLLQDLGQVGALDFTSAAANAATAAAAAHPGNLEDQANF